MAFLSKRYFAVPAVLLLQAAFLFRSAPSSASIEAKGTPHRNALWQKVYSRLPEAWKTKEKVVVREVTRAELNSDSDDSSSSKPATSPGKETDNKKSEATEDKNNKESTGEEESNGDDSFTIGDYNGGEEDNAPPTIRILQTLEGEEASLVFAHEYGHHVWFHILTREQRHSYRRVWWQQKQKDSLVSEYAGEDPSEGFAEAFARYVQQPQELQKKDAESWRFLDGLVKSGKVGRTSKADDTGKSVPGDGTSPTFRP